VHSSCSEYIGIWYLVNSLLNSISTRHLGRFLVQKVTQAPFGTWVAMGLRVGLPLTTMKGSHLLATWLPVLFSLMLPKKE
jgi:hypothetical protein